jgi:tetratricopeptide (TPR) repeat protein
MKEFSFLWAFLVPGVYFTFKKDRIFSFALIFPAVFNILFFSFVARDLTEKGHFFSVALFVFFIFCWQGLFFVYSFLFKNKKPYFLIAIPIFLFFLNKPDFSYGAIFENYEDNVIKTLSKFKNEKVLFTEGDEITFGLLVKKYVKKALNNTEIVNKDMLNAKWYAKKHGTYEKILEKYKFDVFFDTYPQNIYKYYVLPVGILYKIEDKYKKIDVSYFKDYVFGELDAKNVKEAEVIVKRYADAFNNAGLCLVKEGNYAEAKLFFETAIKISPDISYFTNLSKAVKKEKFYKDEIQELEDKKYFKRLIYYLKKEKNYEKISEVYFKLGKYDELKKNSGKNAIFRNIFF